MHVQAGTSRHPVLATELAAVGHPVKSLGMTLSLLARQGRVQRFARGVYRISGATSASAAAVNCFPVPCSPLSPVPPDHQINLQLYRLNVLSSVMMAESDTWLCVINMRSNGSL